MTAVLEGGEWSAARPGRTLPPGKTRYPFYRRLGGPQSRSGQPENLVPTGIRSRTVQPIVSRYTEWATRPTLSWYRLKIRTQVERIFFWNLHLTCSLLWLVAYVVRVHVMVACGGREDDARWRWVSSFTLLVAWPSRKAPPVAVEQETVWAPWLVWMLWKRENCMGNICENIELYKTSGCPGDDGEDYRLLGCGTM